jgi:hypothetical protein
MKHQTRFLSQKPAKVVLSSMEVVAQSLGFKTHIRNFKVKPVCFCYYNTLSFFSFSVLFTLFFFFFFFFFFFSR